MEFSGPAHDWLIVEVLSLSKKKIFYSTRWMRFHSDWKYKLATGMLQVNLKKNGGEV